jgi:hypothetical protein
MENKRRHGMDNDSSENMTCWKLICRDIGCAVLACAMWLSTFYVVFGGNEMHFPTEKPGEISLAYLSIPVGWFH